jgi:rare lipoprotein A
VLRLIFFALGLSLFPQSCIFLMVVVFSLYLVSTTKLTYSAGIFLLLALLACSPRTQTSFAQTIDKPEGVASWYGAEFAGRPTANGEIYDPSQMTAAHRTLPFGTFVRVTNTRNGLSTVVRINDRGPFAKGRIIDVSRAAAEVLDMIGPGTAPVRIELISNEPVHPQTNTVIAADAALPIYDVISADYSVGQLLLLTSSTHPDPIIVRVASNAMPISSGVNMFVSNALFGMLGEHVTVVIGN